MFHNRTLKVLSNLILLLILSAGQIAAAPNKGGGYEPSSSPLSSGVANGYEVNINTSNASANIGILPRDIVLVFDTSASMAYETDNNPFLSEGDDPSVCNLNNTCQPMKAVKDAALGFLDALDFPNDRVSVITMTSQIPDGDRYPYEVLALSSNKADVISAINDIKVFQPRVCNGTDTPGSCLAYYGPSGNFTGVICEIYELAITDPDPAVRAEADPSSCPSSNIGGALNLAGIAFTEEPAQTRMEALWMVIPLLGGPANATDPTVNYPNGFCPENTWLSIELPFCRDRHPISRHAVTDPLVTYINPITGVEDPHSPISLYDAEDYARDMADNLATSISGEGVTIFTIGLGTAVKSTGSSDDYYPDGITKIPPAEYLLKYIAECAGENSPDDCATPVTDPQIRHGQYFFAPTFSSLVDIFQEIANYVISYTGIYYVKPIASGTANCQSWDNACTLQSALTTAVSGDEIWVAAGTYKPTTGTDRAATFQMKTGVNTYGGFSGTESARDQRDPIANVTTLSGDLNSDDAGFTNNSENVYHVVTGANNTILDGFTIAGGNANGSSISSIGGGMLNNSSSPILANISFSENSAVWDGGGMLNYHSNPTLTNVTFKDNSANIGKGGGMYNDSSNPTLMNVTFNSNSALDSGGGVFNYYSSPMLTNITFTGNSAIYYGGGGIYNQASSPMLMNVTFNDNSATNVGGGVSNDTSSSPQISNTIFWGNTAANGAQIYNKDIGSSPIISDSVVQDGYTGTNIITTDPKLGTLGNYGGFTQTIPLLPGSSAINTGDDGTCPATDQRGIIRPQETHCDIGAYEIQDTTAPIVNSITRVDPSPTNLASVDFTVTFSEPVTGVDAIDPLNDFGLTASPGITGAFITGLSVVSETTYTVSVNTGAGNGTIRLDVMDNNSIVDAASNPLGGAALDDGDFISGEIYTIIKSATFEDVPLSYWSSSSIERLYNAGITGGCSLIPLMYCPENTVTRAQMAVFLLRGIHGSTYTPPAVGADTGFADVPVDHLMAAWIKQLAAEGITSGCGNGNYCPDATVTRAQMAVFLLRSKYTSAYTPPPANGDFTDVPLDHIMVAWIEQLAAEGITGGCGAGVYCPDGNVTRDQMAIFLVRTFNLP